MSLGILKVVSLLSEHRDPIMSDDEYNDVIHGRVGLEKFSIDNLDAPIQPETSLWDYIEDSFGDKLTRTYQFVNLKTLMYFVNESLKYQSKIGHSCVTIIDDLTVKVSLQTKGVKEVTELDKELSEYLDLIYKDTQYFYPANSSK